MTRSKLKPWLNLDVMKQKKEELPVDLSDDEVLERGRQLARQSRLLVTLEYEHKAIKSDLKDQMDTEKEERDRLVGVVHNQKEPRLVPVDELGDFDKGLVYRVRRDTGELVGTRNMTNAERQVRGFVVVDDPDLPPEA